MLNQIGGFGLGDRRGLIRRADLIGGAHERATQEGQHKQHPPIAGLRNQQANATGAERLAQHQVQSAAHQKPRWGIGLG